MSHFSYIYWVEEDSKCVALCSLRRFTESSQFLLVGLNTRLGSTSIENVDLKQKKKGFKVKFIKKKKSKYVFMPLTSFL